MPIDTLHPDFQARASQWSRCRDAADGEDAVKAKREDYLPRLKEQQDADYDAYLARGSFFGATGRTIEGLVGAAARKDPEMIVPDALEEMLEDVTLTGQGITEFIKKLCKEVMIGGRAGILVDFNEEKKRPFMAMYCTENVTNWLGDGKQGVVLKESIHEADPADPYLLTKQTQYRELRMEGNRCVVRLHKKGANGADYSYTEIAPGTRKGELDFIPFRFVGMGGGSATPDKPPLLDLVNVNISHYRNSCDLEHGRHFTGLPTPYASGVDSQTTAVYLGSSKVLCLPNPDASLNMLEYKGEGLGALERAMEHKEHQMAVLGASLLLPPKKGVESAETARISKGGESSFLVSLVVAVEEAVEDALQWMCRWAGIGNAEIEVNLNRDFVDAYLTDREILALVQAWQAGAITTEIMLWNFKQGELMPPETDLEELATGLDQEAQKKSEAEMVALKALSNSQQQADNSPDNGKSGKEPQDKPGMGA